MAYALLDTKNDILHEYVIQILQQSKRDMAKSLTQSMFLITLIPFVGGFRVKCRWLMSIMSNI